MSQRSKLEIGEIDLCVKAVRRSCENPRHTRLNLESLGRRPDHNRWSIRGSREQQVILAVNQRVELDLAGLAG